jgi:hypothetical protein
VDHERFTALDAALRALQDRVTKLAGDAARDPAKIQLKRYTADEQVVARLELAGPERRLASTHAGVDVHGDGSTEAYVGRVRRRAVAAAPGEDGISALRRALLNS